MSRARSGAVALTALAVTALSLTLAPSRAQASLARVGRRPALPEGARFVSQAPPALRMHVTITLRPRDPAALAAYAQAVSTPGSPQFHAYLTPSAFHRRFGATSAEVGAVRTSLRARGLHPGPVSAGGLSIPVTATAWQLEHAFEVSLSRLSLPGRRTAIATDERPAIAAAVAPAVQSVLGLDTTTAMRPLLARSDAALTDLTPAGAAPRSTAHAGSAGPQPCAAATAAQSSPNGEGAYTDNELASAYDFSGLYAEGDEGGGVTVAVYELEPDDPNDIAAYQSCYGTHAQITYVPVDGGAGTGPGAGEAALDIENLIGFAPDVHLLVYQGPNSDSSAPGSGPYDVFSAIVNQDRAQVVSVSWGQCEPEVGQSAAAAENTLFEQATVQGQSIVAADGDSGAQDCDDGSTPPQIQVSVDDPSSQPYVTGVGGTTLSALGPPPTETVWNTGGVALSGELQNGASGGGVSSFWPMPAAQLDAASSLGVRSPVPGDEGCGDTTCREVPDVAADADPATGYMFYWNGSGQEPDTPTGWQGIGGTSAASPLWAALLALADASSACAGSPVGYADPALYRAAGEDYAADFHDVTTGDNDFTGTNDGQYAAKPGYDPVSGLGTPDAAALAPALCANTVRLSVPGSERSALHTTVSLRLHATDAAGTALTWESHGLPPGLKLNGSTGVISGRFTKTGRYTVDVSAHDSEDSGIVRGFTWTVGAAPRISGVSLSTARRRPRLAFTVSAGRNAPDLRVLAVTLPRGLRLVRARRGVSVKTTARRAKAVAVTDRLSGSERITLTLRKVTGSVRVTLAAPELRVSGGRVASARGAAASELTVSVTDNSSGRSRVTARLAGTRR